MNREIQELRETITKLVPLLTGKGLAVTQRGSQAYVKTDPRTKKPTVVNIPNISDNATPEFCEAIQGYIDHEVAHVLITDWHHYAGGPSAEQLRDPKVQQFMQTHNIVEDTMIEREIVRIFPGSRKNIAKLRQEFIKTISDPAIKARAGDPKDQFTYLLVPLMRALAGHEEFIDQMDRGDYWKNPYCQGVLKGLKPTTLDALKTVSTTKDTLWIARELHDVLFPPAPPAPPAAPKAPAPPPPPSDRKSKGKSEDKPQKEAGEGDGDGDRKHDDSKDKDDEGTKGAGKPESEEDDDDGVVPPASAADEDGDDADDGAAEAGDVDDDAAPGASGDDDDGDEDAPSPGDEDDGSDDDEAGEEDDADGDLSSFGDEGDLDPDSDAGEEGEAPVAREGGGEQAVGPAGEDSAGKVDETNEEDDGTNGGGIGKSETNEGLSKSLFDFDDDAFEGVDMQSAIGSRITEEAITSLADSDYNVFTRDFDRIEPAPLPANINSKWIPEMEETISTMVGRMQKDIERLMASQSHVIRTPGQRKGRLHAPSLYRVMQNDDRVFTVKAEHKSKDTAVTLLIDNSGSMRGSKMKTAMLAGYALSSTLDRVKIAHEVIGFTTGDYGTTPQALLDALEEEMEKATVRYHRVEPLVMPIYKGFDEKIDSQVKGRIAYAANAQIGLAGNIDGECLQYAAQRLSRRMEKRKVLIVLSDGYPAGAMAPQHLKWVVEDLAKNGIECIGIGIESAAVKDYYPKHVVLNNVSALPGQVMGELRQLLQ